MRGMIERLRRLYLRAKLADAIRDMAYLQLVRSSIHNQIAQKYDEIDTLELALKGVTRCTPETFKASATTASSPAFLLRSAGSALERESALPSAN